MDEIGDDEFLLRHIPGGTQRVPRSLAALLR